MDDYADLLGVPEPEYEKKAKAYAALLRAQEADAGKQQALGLLLQFTGDKDLARMGQGLVGTGSEALQGARRSGEKLSDAPGQRLTMALQRLNLQKGEADAQAAERQRALAQDAGSLGSQLRRRFAQKLKIDVPEDATAEVLDNNLLGLAERMYETEQRSADRSLDRAARQAELDAKLSAGADKKKDDTLKLATDLRKEFQGTPVYKATQDIATSYKKIMSTTPTAAGDMSMIFAYMKMLDPSSTVREGEQAQAREAGSIPQNIIAYYNKAVTGQQLLPAVRDDFRKNAELLLQTQLGRYKSMADSYKRLASQAGAAPDDVVLDLGMEAPAAAPAPKADLTTRVRQLAKEGLTPKQIAEKLNAEGGQ